MRSYVDSGMQTSGWKSNSEKDGMYLAALKHLPDCWLLQTAIPPNPGRKRVAV